MNAKVADLMTEAVVTTEPHATVERVRRILERNKVSAIPVVDADGAPLNLTVTLRRPPLHREVLLVRVLTADGRPVPFARIDLVQGDPRRPYPSGHATVANGWFAVDEARWLGRHDPVFLIWQARDHQDVEPASRQAVR